MRCLTFSQPSYLEVFKMLSDELVEKVARGICWGFSEDTDDCSIKCLNAKRCMADTVDRCFTRDARAALEAAGVSRMMEALIEARKVVASDADACEAFGPNEFSEPHRVLSIIDEALGSVTV